MLDMPVVKGRSGTGGQGIAGIKIMREFFKADLLALGPAHAVEFGGDNGIIARFPFSREEIADTPGGSPFYFGNKLSDDMAANCHKLNKRGDVFLWRSPARGFISYIFSVD